MTTYTSDVENAGTDSGIHITLNDGVIKSKEWMLDDGRNNHERGSIESFIIVTQQIMEQLKTITIRNDGSSSKGWHLNKVLAQIFCLLVLLFQNVF